MDNWESIQPKTMDEIRAFSNDNNYYGEFWKQAQTDFRNGRLTDPQIADNNDINYLLMCVTPGVHDRDLILKKKSERVYEGASDDCHY